MTRLYLSIFGIIAAAEDCVAEPPRWCARLDEAKQVAASTGKDLLLNFTDREHCAPCALLESNILSKPEFASAADLFVLVDLDSSAAERLPEDERRAALQWRSDFGIESVPTIILADSRGRPYAKTGHRDFDAAAYVAHLKELQRARIARDAALAMLDKTTGQGRALAIETVLAAIDGPLSQGPELRTDPLLLFYDRLVHDVIAADPDNALGLKARYEGRVTAADEMSRVNDFYDELRRLSKSEGHDAAVARLDERLRTEPRADLRRRYAVSREIHLEWGDRHEAALAAAREIAADNAYSLVERRRMRERIGWNLFRLHRWDEGRDALLQLAAELGDDRPAAFRVMYSMATWVAGDGPEEMAEQAFRSAEALAVEGSSDWWEAQILHARLLGSRYGRHREAAERQQRLLEEHQPDPTLKAVLLVDLMQSRLGQGLPEMASGHLGRARAALEELRGRDRNDLDWLEARLRRVQAACERYRPPSPPLPRRD